ncbi:MAG: MurR/RpiR family transcriptional regulator [Bacillota bacterium]|nr:MurR/RpiR family transcriptional regulator [Bacillota bacterium]
MAHDSLMTRLFRYVNSQNKKDTNHDIAVSLLRHYNEIPDKTINELADMCYASPASISRFVKTMGFDSFQDFKETCRNTLQINSTDYSLKTVKSDRNEMSEIFNRYTKDVISNIIFAKETLEYDQLEDVCSSIRESDRILVLGLEFSTLLSQHIQSRFALMNKYVEVALSYEEQIEAAKSMTENSTVIILSLEGGFIYRREDVVKVLREKNVKIILITMNGVNKVVNEFEKKQIILCGKSNENTEGRIALLYIIEIIIMYYLIYYSY